MFACHRHTAAAKALILLLATLVAAMIPVSGAELTGLEALREANRQVGAEAKNKILQVRSERSTNGLAPKTWSVMFYDASVGMKTTVVKLSAGREPRIDHPFALFKRPDPKRIFDPSSVRIDSDAALKVAAKDRLLEKVKLNGARITLELWEGSPVWKIEFWAEKAKEPARTPAIGQIFVDGQEGKVVNRDLHISRTE